MDSQKIYTVIPNWNGADRLGRCLESLAAQTQKGQVIVVDNGSHDNSVELVQSKFPDVQVIRHNRNYGFTGGVNAGIKAAMESGAKYVALINNDAVADKDWLKQLAKFLDDNPKAGIATSKICDRHKRHLDSTGDFYTVWGLPYPRGRAEPYGNNYDKDKWVF